MRTVLLVASALCVSIANAQDAEKPAVTPEERAVVAINKQIEKFNAERQPRMGISLIRQQVSRVQYDKALDQVTCLDQNGKTFLVLSREADGRLKGILKVEFHQLVGANPDGSHSWGTVQAPFFLEKDLFPPVAGK